MNFHKHQANFTVQRMGKVPESDNGEKLRVSEDDRNIMKFHLLHLFIKHHDWNPAVGCFSFTIREFTFFEVITKLISSKLLLNFKLNDILDAHSKFSGRLSSNIKSQTKLSVQEFGKNPETERKINFRLQFQWEWNSIQINSDKNYCSMLFSTLDEKFCWIKRYQYSRKH